MFPQVSETASKKAGEDMKNKIYSSGFFSNMLNFFKKGYPKPI